jgi:hypothetical protein
MRRILALVLVLCAGAVEASYVRTTPYRPDACDRSIKWVSNQNYLAYCDLCGDPHTCSQYERDVKAAWLVDDATRVDAALQFVCPSEHKKAWSASFLGDSGLYPRLLWPYQARTIMKAGGGLWITAPDDNTYSIARNVLKFFRACIVSSSKRAAAATALARFPALRTVLNVNDTMTGPAPFAFAIDQANPPAVDPVRAALAPFDSRPANASRQGALARRPADAAALEAVHQAHSLASTGGTADVQGAHFQYEALCGSDETCLHYRFALPFNPGCDPGWTPIECLYWLALEDVFHTVWSDTQPLGDAKHTDEAVNDHRMAHLCANVGASSPVIAIFSCAEQPANVPQCPGPGGQLGRNTCRAFLPFLAAKYL